jgi:uncharacterized protein
MKGQRRLPGVDLARALAIFGMVAVNFDQILSVPQSTGLSAKLLALPAGRASALFVVLAGIGLSLLARRDVGRGRRVAFRRGLFFLALGYLFWVVWPGDILHYYGWYFIVGGMALNWGNRVLALGVAVVTLTAPALLMVFDYGADWDFTRLEYQGLLTWTGQTRNLLFNGFHPLFPWLAFLFYGLWLGRRLVADPGRVERMIWPALAVAVATEWISHSIISNLGGLEKNEAAYLFVTDSMPPSLFYVLAAGALATFTLALCLRVAHRWESTLIMRGLLHTGQLAFSLYVLHVLIGAYPLIAIQPERSMAPAFVLGWCGGFCLLSIVGSHLWRLRFSQGPAEAVLRRFTHSAPQSAVAKT